MSKSKSISLLLIVMTAILIGFASPTAAQGPQVPQRPATGNVLDQAGWFSPAQLKIAYDINLEMRTSQTGYMVFAVLNDCGAKENHKAFAYNVFNGWKVGDATLNNGVLLVVCWQGGDPALRTIWPVPGNGIKDVLTEQVLSDLRTKYFRPLFVNKDAAAAAVEVRNGNASTALLSLAMEIQKIVHSHYDKPMVALQPTGQAQSQQPTSLPTLTAQPPLSIVIATAVVSNPVSRASQSDTWIPGVPNAAVILAAGFILIVCLAFVVWLASGMSINTDPQPRTDTMANAIRRRQTQTRVDTTTVYQPPPVYVPQQQPRHHQQSNSWGGSAPAQPSNQQVHSEPVYTPPANVDIGGSGSTWPTSPDPDPTPSYTSPNVDIGGSGNASFDPSPSPSVPDVSSPPPDNGGF